MLRPFLLPGAILLAALSIAGPPPARPGLVVQQPGTLLEQQAAASDPSQTFTAYLPPGYDASRRWPLLFVFDPRGRGTLAARIFLPAAERYGWIVVSSNNTRSDGPWEPNARAVAALWADALARYAVDRRRIYAAGFSGGATVAWALGAESGELAGVIAAGAPHQPAIVEATPAPAWFGAAGRHDFNYRDTVAIRDSLSKRADVRTVFFDGRHQWLGPETAMRAVGWLEMLAIRDGRRAPDPALVRDTFARDRRDAEALEAGSRLLEAADAYRSLVRTYEGIAPLDDARDRLARITGAKPYDAAVKADARADRYERSRATDALRVLARVLEAGELVPPNSVLNDMRIRAIRREASRDGHMGEAAARALERVFVQAAFYLPGNLEAEGRIREAALALEVAAGIFPSRPGPWYSLARARARLGSVNAAFDALGRAIDAGFDDADRMEADGTFERLRSDERWAPLLKRIGG